MLCVNARMLLDANCITETLLGAPFTTQAAAAVAAVVAQEEEEGRRARTVLSVEGRRSHRKGGEGEARRGEAGKAVTGPVR